MAQASDIREHMEVVGSDGAHVGIVDQVQGDLIRLARGGASDDRPHHLPISAVAAVDDKVRLNTTGAAALAIAGAGASGVGAETVATDGIVPPVHNRAVEGAPARRNFYLPWIVGVVGLVLLLMLLMRACTPKAQQAPPVTEAESAVPADLVGLPDGTQVSLVPHTLPYDVQRYLASAELSPRTFTFDRLNFDTASAALRRSDQGTIDALAAILNGYPQVRARIVGYADARGSAPANANLGQQRAEAVVTALAAKGVDRGRLTAASGGEGNPLGTNATPQGRAENRRSDLIVTAK